jgi:hypothetical protein
MCLPNSLPNLDNLPQYPHFQFSFFSSVSCHSTTAHFNHKSYPILSICYASSVEGCGQGSGMYQGCGGIVKIGNRNIY